jgi:hypothetical protein
MELYLENPNLDMLSFPAPAELSNSFMMFSMEKGLLLVFVYPIEELSSPILFRKLLEEVFSPILLFML